MKVWAELKYGVKGHGITICKLDTPHILRVFKRCALQRAKQFSNQSNGIDEILHFYDELELERLRKLLERIIPNDEDGFKEE